METFSHSDQEQEKILDEKKQADQGIADAQLQVDLCYEKGIGIGQSDELALHYYQLAADQGHPEAQVLLARLYKKISDYGNAFHYYYLAEQTHQDNHSIQIEVTRFVKQFIKTSPQQAFECFQLAVYQNDPLVLYYLAECFLKGIGTKPSLKKAFNYYQLASHQGYFYELTVIARSLFDMSIHQKIIARFLKTLLSDMPFIRARQFYELAKLFTEGKILLYSPQAALHFYTLSADAEYKLAQKQLADIYFKGLLGIEKNKPLALHYYLLSNKISVVSDLAEQYEETFPQRAFDYYQLIYETDQASGASYLDHCYKKGIGVEKSLDTAIHYYKIACKGGLKFSCFSLGCCLEEMETEEALSQAIHYYQMGAERNSYSCQYRLAELYEQGKGLPQSFEKAYEYYSLAAKHGSSRAWFQVGRCLTEGIGTKKSLEEAVKAYELCGDDEACYQLAISYIEGKGVTPSPQRARHYLISLAKRGMLKGCSKLADLLEAEFSIDHQELPLSQRFLKLAQQLQDNKLATVCFQIAGDLGGLEDAHQQYRLALNYDDMKNYEKAFEFFNKAANQGDNLAQYSLGRYFQQGKGCSQSWEKAVHYYKLASNQGNAQAFYELGICYDRGLGGLERSPQHAFEYFTLSADQGYAKALCALGLYYEMGRYVKQSTNRAFYYFELAAEQNAAEGQYHVGRFHRLDRRYGDTLLSLQEALRYYHLALKQGYRKPFLKAQIKRCQELIHRQRDINASRSKLPFNCVIFPQARKIDIRSYLKDRNLDTLRKIFRRSRHHQLILEGHTITIDEAHVIREGMLENPCLTFIGAQTDVECLYLAFELAGYQRKNLRCLPVEHFSPQFFGLLFISNRKPPKYFST